MAQQPSTLTIRKLGISLDPEEMVDFAMRIDEFSEAFTELGFEQSGTYTFRYGDDECMMKAELQRSADGYFLWLYVQASDEHEWRAQEIADVFGAVVITKGK